MIETGILMKARQNKITIAVICVSIFIIAAAVIASIVIAIVLANKNTTPTSHYYIASFKIINREYRPSYRESGSGEFKALSAQMESMAKETFEDSVLKGVYNSSKVISLGSGILEPTLVILFQVPPNESKNFSSAPIQEIFRNVHTIASRSNYYIDKDSVQLSEIQATTAENLIYGDCGVGGPAASASRIVGGNPASPGSWPWQASLRRNGNHKCGASLISNTWLISAAHCFELGNDVNSWTVVLGSMSLSSGSGLKLRRIIVYDTYSTADRSNDIALLELSEPVNYNQNIRTVCLPKESDNFPDGSSCYVTGWGAVEFDGRISPVLRQAEVKIINEDLCSSPTMYGSIIKPSMLCAGYVEGKVDACQGDSGGPLVTQRHMDKWFLIGVVSFGDDCGLPNKPGVYCKISFLRNWIKQKTGL